MVFMEELNHKLLNVSNLLISHHSQLFFFHSTVIELLKCLDFYAKCNHKKASHLEKFAFLSYLSTYLRKRWISAATLHWFCCQCQLYVVYIQEFCLEKKKKYHGSHHVLCVLQKRINQTIKRSS